MKISIRALKLTKILGQPCEFQVRPGARCWPPVELSAELAAGALAGRRTLVSEFSFPSSSTVSITQWVSTASSATSF
jgi:hypothetical protein